MTELRDARLRQALDAAPDAELRPPERTRAAIQAAAQAALQPAWRRWWEQSGERRTVPWIAAFASVVLATLVTLLWQQEEVPGPRPAAPASEQVASAPPPTPAPAPAAPAPAPAAPRAAPVPPPAAPQRAPRAEAPPQEARMATAPDAAPTAAARDAATPAAPPSPAAAPMAAPAAGAAAPSRAELGPAPRSATDWTQVRIEANGRSVVVPAAQAQRLASLLTRMLSAPSEPAAPGGKASLKLELAQGDAAIGVLEQVGEDWHWTPLHIARPAQLLRPDPAVADALEKEAQRLLR